MAIYLRKLGLVTLAMTGIVVAAPNPGCYVVDGRGKKHQGVELLVKSTQGDLELVVDGRVRIPFKAGAYRMAFIPKPAEVNTLGKVFAGGRHEAVAKVADSLFNKYKFVGWGGYIAYLEGMSLIELGKPENALKAFSKGRRFRGEYTGRIQRGIVLALLDMKATDKVKPMLAKMIASPHEAEAAFAFNARARILADEGKNKEAVLEYLKVLLFFENSSAVKDLRDTARTRAVEIMKTMNDGRWKRVEKIN